MEGEKEGVRDREVQRERRWKALKQDMNLQLCFILNLTDIASYTDRQIPYYDGFAVCFCVFLCCSFICLGDTVISNLM